MKVEPWQVPILVMAGIILAELVIRVIPRRWTAHLAKQQVRTVALGGLAVLIIVVGVLALGPDLADQIASVAAAVAGLAALWLTYRSYQLQTAASPGAPAEVGPVGPERDTAEPEAAGTTGQPSGR
ncbi:hypothetical protein [Micromonospora matsumotoense]|uniref:hypothetical protein n=1 Tax=Micromonospora matsumotoense TaxID=121616 RepID=UPI0033D0023B